MNRKPCPTERELLAFADADLSPEQLQRVERHLEGCSPCAEHVMELTRLMSELAAPVTPASFDVTEHVEAVMQRLDTPVAARARPRLAPWAAVGAAALAAAAVLLLFSGEAEGPGQLAARGGAAEPALSRDVGVQLYTQAPELRALAAGARIYPGSALTAGVRNTGRAAAHLLLFAVDANDVVHWIAPEYTLPGSNPPALSVAPSVEERLLPTAAVFDDLAPGALRVVVVLSSEPASVADVEALTAEQLGSRSLTQRFPRAEVRELVLQVSPGAP